jgi:DNA-binding NarL/FixJ family response regulator
VTRHRWSARDLADSRDESIGSIAPAPNWRYIVTPGHGAPAADNANTRMEIRVVIAEDHAIFREGLRALLTTLPNVMIVGESDNGRDAVHQALSLHPDLILMDISMPNSNGIEAIRKIRKRVPDTKIITLTMHRNEEYVREALLAGTNGYVLKDASWSELSAAINVVLTGMTYLSPSISNIVVSGYLTAATEGGVKTSWDQLSEREREVLKMIAEGSTNKSIAAHLCLSVKTVEKHRASLMKKLNLHNASALISYAIERGLVTAPHAQN